MPGTLTELPGIQAEPDPREGAAGVDHPMRVVTREAIGGDGGWSSTRRREVNELFDRLADVWHTRDGPDRHLPLLDAVERGKVPRGRCLELGSGTGLVTAWLVEVFESVLAADLAMEMLRRAPTVAPRLRVDGTALPLPDASIDALVLMNMLLFPAEVERVLAPEGAVVWVNSRGAGTPIHLPAQDVVEALPGVWHGTASTHGSATWCVARRG